MGISRSTYRYNRRGIDHATEFRHRVVNLASQHKRYGYRRITALLKRDERVNHKRVWRVWKAEGLSLSRRRPKKRHTGNKQLPTRAGYRGQVRTYDFVYDRTESNRMLKMLVVLDEYTRECHRVRVEYSLDSEAVTETLGEMFELYGAPQHLRSDNGPEFIAERLKGWGAKTVYIEPGHPWENGYGESFIGKFRDECLIKGLTLDYNREVRAGRDRELEEAVQRAEAA